jgi:hypothetical protein
MVVGTARPQCSPHCRATECSAHLFHGAQDLALHLQRVAARLPLSPRLIRRWRDTGRRQQAEEHGLRGTAAGAQAGGRAGGRAACAARGGGTGARYSKQLLRPLPLPALQMLARRQLLTRQELLASSDAGAPAQTPMQPQPRPPGHTLRGRLEGRRRRRPPTCTQLCRNAPFATIRLTSASSSAARTPRGTSHSLILSTCGAGAGREAAGARQAPGVGVTVAKPPPAKPLRAVPPLGPPPIKCAPTSANSASCLRSRREETHPVSARSSAASENSASASDVSASSRRLSRPRSRTRLGGGKRGAGRWQGGVCGLSWDCSGRAAR